MSATVAPQPATDPLGLAGRTALVTGGSRGLGLAIVRAFARAGMNVVTCCRDDATAQELTADLATEPGDHRVVTADVTDPESVARLVAACRDHLGTLDVVVNNVGASGVAPAADMPGAEWARVLDHNLTAAFLVSQASLPVLRDGGSLIVVGSAVAFRGLADRAHYTAAKAAQVGLIRSLCKELSPRRIRVNLVAPGILDTPEKAHMPEKVREHYRSLIALGRLGPPDEVAGAVVFLASDLGRYVNGSTVTVDGGI